MRLMVVVVFILASACGADVELRGAVNLEREAGDGPAARAFDLGSALVVLDDDRLHAETEGLRLVVSNQAIEHLAIDGCPAVLCQAQTVTEKDDGRRQIDAEGHAFCAGGEYAFRVDAIAF
jgi:hypothetical protein